MNVSRPQDDALRATAWGLKLLKTGPGQVSYGFV